jgi:hypothetical protein
MMPGAANRAVLDQTFIERAAKMRAFRSKGIDVAVVPQKENFVLSNASFNRLAVGKRG